MLNNLSVREKVLLYITLLAVIVGGYFIFLYQPLQEEIEILETQKTQNEEDLEQLENILININELRDRYENLSQRQEIIEEEQKTVTELLREFNQTASHYNIRIRNFNSRQEPEKIHLYFVMEGEYKSLANIFNTIDQNNRRIEFEELTMQPLQNLAEIIKVEFYAVYYI